MSAAGLSDVLFWIFLASAGAATAGMALGPRAWAEWVAWPALAVGLAMMAAICATTGRPPLSGTFESLGLMAFLLACLAMASRFGPEAHPPLAAASWAAALILLVLLALVPRKVNPDWFIYAFGWTRAFFLLRLVAMSLLLYSALIALCWPGKEHDAPQRRRLVSRSRRYLLLGTAAFLVGEVCGFYWCLTWRGDYWLWNRNFLESTMIFLLASAALHLPPRLAANPKALRLAYSVPGLLAMTAYLVHQITEAYL